MKLSEFLDRLSDYTGPDSKGDYLGICPGHDDNSPSLLVGQDSSDGRLLLHCRAGCPKETVLASIGLTMRDLFSADDRPDATLPTSKATAHRDGPGPAEIAALRDYTEQCAQRLTGEGEWPEAARTYIQERFGLSLEDAATLRLGLDPGGAWYTGALDFGPTYLQVPRLVIPFFGFDGVIRGLQARSLVDHPLRWSGPMNPEGRTFSKYAVIDRGTGLDTIVLTEGPGDALTASAAGFDALAIRGATVVVNEDLQAELVAALRGRRIVLAGDDDDAGRNYNRSLAEVFQAAGLSVFVLPWRGAPAGAKDVTAWHEADPQGFTPSFQRAIDRAEHPDRDTSQNVPDGDRFTEVGMARRLRARLAEGTGPQRRDGVRFAPGLGFYLWSGSHWEHDLTGHRLHREAQRMVEELYDEADEALARGNLAADVEEAWKRQRSAAVRFESSTLLQGIIREMEAMVFVDRDEMDRHHHLLSVANGTIDLRDGTLNPHRREDLITRCLPIEYDPAAECPRWERFLVEVFPGEPDMPDFMRRLVGYGITGETSEQAFAVLHGTGANGKSVFTDTLTEIFRAITVTTPFSTFEAKPSGGIPNDLASLNGARLVLASEGEQGKLMAESVIKRVTGQDLISARFMRQEFFEFRPTFLILLATNHKPRFRGQDEGLWRRVKLIPFRRYFRPEERDHHLVRTLRSEAAGILAWAVRGAQEWYAADGLGEPDSIRTATATYRDTADGLLGFAELYLRPDPEGRVRTKDVFERFKAHLIEEGVKESDIWSPRAFYDAMEERGYARKKVRIAGRPEWALLGLRLLTEEEASEDLEEGPEPEHDPRPVGARP